MDFLDPKKQRAHSIRLIVGYILIGVAILIATTLLLRIAFGFGLDKNGQVVQSGFVFVSSQPGGAKVYLNNKLNKSTTSTRLQLPEGNYSLGVSKDGYRPWQRNISVLGGMVFRYDYPLLIPNNLISSPVRTYASLPGLYTESPDRHWLLVERPDSKTDFDLYDISDHKQVTANVSQVTLPANVVPAADEASINWQVTEWSNDNRHVMLQYQGATGMQYVLVDTQDASKSRNLSKGLDLSNGQTITLIDKKYDKYYVFDAAAKTLGTATLETPTVAPILSNVLAYKSYSDNMVLYATEDQASVGQVQTMLKDGDVTYKVREVAAGGPYLMDMVQYDGDWFVAVGSSAENKEYVFKNPQAARKAGTLKNLVPIQTLRVAAPNYIEFSANTRFVMVENGTDFAVYDVEYDKGYSFTATQPLDAPQTHATWMDGDRILYVSGGKALEFDYDYTNPQTLISSTPNVLALFDRDYRYAYTLTPPSATTGETTLNQTSLLIPKDQ